MSGVDRFVICAFMVFCAVSFYGVGKVADEQEARIVILEAALKEQNSEVQ